MPMSPHSEDMVEGQRFEEEVSCPKTTMLQRNKGDRRCCPQVLQRRTARNFRHPLGHPAAHLETRPTGDTGESLQDEDERGRMIVGQQDSMSFTSAGTRKGSWIPGDYRQRSGECLSRPWRVEVSAVAFSSLRHPVLTPFTRWDSLATLCHRRCRETLSRSLGPCGCLGVEA